MWGTTLSCETLNKTIEKVVFKSDVKNGSTGWVVKNFIVPSDLMFENQWYTWTGLIGGTAYEQPEAKTITHHFVNEPRRSHRYYPCQDVRINSASGILVIPDTGMHVLVPVKETVCRPRLTRYSVTISHTSGTQQVLVATDDLVPAPAYTPEFAKFSGSSETWVQVTDALAIYSHFQRNFNVSGIKPLDLWLTEASISTKEPSYETVNNTKVESCIAHESRLVDETRFALSATHPLWALPIFEWRKARPNTYDPWWPYYPTFDTEIAKALLINTTISTLSLNRNFDTVPGTYTRNFNVYKFSNKLAFFLPYGLALALCIPVIALGLVAFYTRNQGVSAITGRFLQIRMTTTGQGALEAVITKGSGIMGGQENVSDELRETELRFGELIEVDEHEQVQSTCRARVSISSSDSIQRGDDGSGEMVAQGFSEEEEGTSDVGRVGFGVPWQVRSLRRRATGHMQ